MRRYLSLLFTLLIIMSLFGCAKKPVSVAGGYDVQNVMQTNGIVTEFDRYAQVLSEASGLDLTASFLRELGKKETVEMVAAVEAGGYTELTWHEITGFSYHVISDMLDGTIDAENVTNLGDNGQKTFTLSFAGDIVFDPERPVMLHAAENGGVLNCFDSELIKQVNNADFFMLNNEFAISERGEPMTDKAYTFRASPDCIDYLKKLGVDAVSLANNHVYDYSEDAFYDTMENLSSAGLPYVGAGYNVNEAAKGRYFIINGFKVGIVATSRAEKFYLTPTADFNRAGVMGTYNSRYFLSAIEMAREQCDIVIVYAHWGTEYSTKLEQQQIKMSREYIDAGADAVIGSHPHCLQGMEYYKNAPIAYSLGNFWFNDKALDSCLLNLEIDSELNVQVSLTPLIQENCETRLVTDAAERRALFNRVESYEPQGVAISDDGVVTPIA